MASTGDADQKRRHVSSISPTPAVSMAKKQHFSLLSEDKKLDTAVLQFQNQKLSQKLEAQKLEINALQSKLFQRKEKQQSFDRVLTTVNNCYEKLADDVEARSTHIKHLVSSGEKSDHSVNNNDGASCSSDANFIKRIMETNPSESCLASSSVDQTMEEGDKDCVQSRNILCNLVSAVDDLQYMNSKFYDAVLSAVPEDDGRRKTSNDLATEVKDLRSTVCDLYVKHRSLARELRTLQDSDLRNKANLKYLRGDLESTIRELEDCNQQLAALKAEKDVTMGAFFPVLSMGNKHIGHERATDKQKDMEEMESRLKELMAHSSSRLQELKRVHEERVDILKKLSSFQGTLKNVKSISSTRAFKSVKEDLEKSKKDVVRCQAVCEKLQVEKDKVLWKERDAMVRSDVGDSFRRTLTSTGFNIDEIETSIRRHKDLIRKIEATLKEASREPGRKEVISKFREFVSSFPEDMSSMQSNLQKYKKTASDIHSLRAEVQSVSNILVRKTKEFATLSSTSADQAAEIWSLQAVVEDLKESDMDLKLFAEMFGRESAMPSNFVEARDKEFRAWARVHSLKLSLDEHNMESRVKTAIKAEALSQRTLAAAEAEIANLREKCESSERNKSKLSNDLKSKHDENEAYLFEIETIGQAYDDMQNQNQQLLKQITERDDYNIKLVLEGLRGKQTRDSLLAENQNLQKKIQQANVSRDLFEVKATQIEDRVKNCANQIHRVAEDRCQNTIVLENMQRRLFEAKKSSQQGRESLDELQNKVVNSRSNLSGLQIDVEKERFEKRRLEEDSEAVKRKAERLRAEKEGSIVGKLNLELREYKEILKCSICLDRPKEVVITKCYHLLCDPCVQKVLKTRHRKCPVCAASFNANDVKPVYI
ncbi:hypothetical protein RND81_02G108100 [Saponaria officinalis]|uniref:E3 ubiquitin protein ligase n=1 Tax=Saponaria officinalis TaxID=3572 RepID=A0AAW1MT34_SAPOF